MADEAQRPDDESMDQPPTDPVEEASSGPDENGDAETATPQASDSGQEESDADTAAAKLEEQASAEKKSELLGVTSNVDAFSAEPEKEDEDSGAGDLDELDRILSEDDEEPKAGEAFEVETCCSVRRIALELKHVEQQVREILDSLDTRRKRRLTGTRRWLDLQEDMINWRYGNKFDVATLDRLQQLVAQRHHLYRRLHFLSGTRPTWNS